jgi:hypothetical protein
VPKCLRLRQRRSPRQQIPKFARHACGQIQCSAGGSPRAGSSGVQCSASAGVSERPGLELQRRDVSEAQPLSLSDWDRLRLKRAAGQSKIVPFRRKLRTPSSAPCSALQTARPLHKAKSPKYLQVSALLGAAIAAALISLGQRTLQCATRVVLDVLHTSCVQSLSRRRRWL